MEIIPRKPDERLTRFDFYMELIRDWEQHERFAEARGYDMIANNLRIAQRVLKASIRVGEVFDLEHLATLEEDNADIRRTEHNADYRLCDTDASSAKEHP